MDTLTVAFLGDIYGSPGRQVVEQQLPRLRAEHQPDLIIANAENVCSGSGLSPRHYERLRGCGIDGITLGDHVYREQKIVSVLEDPAAPILRPANLPTRAVGRPYIRLRREGRSSVFVITVLGRIFMNLPSDDPFATVDRLLESLPEREGMVIVEAHMEATSEKAALARYLDGRVSAVVGTHTHVPTADARVLPHGTAFITDLGMCGPYNSIIGAEPNAVIRHMTTGMYSPYQVGSGDEAMCGVILRIDESGRKALSIDSVRYEADYSQPPFARV